MKKKYLLVLLFCDLLDENSVKNDSEIMCLFFILQLIWYNSYQIGCAVAYCSKNQFNYFYVCQYCPAYVLSF